MLFAGKGLSDGKKKAQDALYGFCGEKRGMNQNIENQSDIQ